MTMTQVVIPATISHSALTTYRHCPQKWNYQTLQGLSVPPEVVSPFRDFGTWWHALRAADAIERGYDKGSLLSAPPSLKTPDGCPDIPVGPGGDDLQGAVHRACWDWWKHLDDERRLAYAEAYGETGPERLYQLDQSWWDEYEDDNHAERPLAVEARWERILPGTNLTIVGITDQVLFDTKRNLTVVRDHKSAKNLATQTVADDLMDSQLHLYAWGVTPLLRETRYRIGAVAYDRVRTVAPQPPALTLAGNIRVRDGEPALSGCDLRTYLAWAQGEDGRGVPYPGSRKDGSGAGRYTADERIIERLSTPAHRSIWFQRTLTPINRNIIRAHLQAAVDSARDSLAMVRRVQDTGEAPRNLTAACKWCEFARLCRAQMFGGPDGDYPLAEYGLVQRQVKDAG